MMRYCTRGRLTTTRSRTQSRAKPIASRGARGCRPHTFGFSRPAEYAARRECKCWLRRSSVCSDAPEDAGGTGHHSEAGNEGDGADHDPSKEWNMDEQAQWHKKVEDNPHNKN